MDDLRGDLHDHTDWSGDGRMTLRQLLDVAVARRWEYVAVTDHAECLRINGLDREAMRRQRARTESATSTTTAGACAWPAEGVCHVRRSQHLAGRGVPGLDALRLTSTGMCRVRMGTVSASSGGGRQRGRMCLTGPATAMARPPTG